MKSEKEAVDCFRTWFRTNTVGNFIVYHAPNSPECEIILEQVIKKREMPPEVAAAFEYFMDELKVERGEVHRDADGRVDRIKITRRYDP